jgi:hypothetical protein
MLTALWTHLLRGTMASHPISTSHPIHEGTWLSLTDLGRLHGISAVQCGRLLEVAGVRQRDGAPSRQALRSGLARRPAGRRRPGGELWHRSGCGEVLESHGVEPTAQRRIVEQWVDLLEALIHAGGAISTTPQDMASELPLELRAAVNARLQERGCDLQLQPGRGADPAG